MLEAQERHLVSAGDPVRTPTKLEGTVERIVGDGQYAHCYVRITTPGQYEGRCGRWESLELEVVR